MGGTRTAFSNSASFYSVIDNYESLICIKFQVFSFYNVKDSNIVWRRSQFVCNRIGYVTVLIVY